MQIPQVVTLFGRQMQTYTLVISAAICIVIVLVTRRAPRGSRWATVDMCLAGLVVALVLARVEHVLLRWDYYVEHLDQALDVRRGGLGWHGAVLGAWLGMCGYLRLTSPPTPLQAGEGDRTSPPSPLSARGEGEPEASSTALEVPSPCTERGFRGEVIPYPLLAFALPLMAAAAWVGCAAAGCAYGAEVRTLADYAPGVTAELRDVYGIIAPRWNTPLYGLILAGVMLSVVVGVQWIAPGLELVETQRTRRASSLQHTPHRATHRAPRTFFLALAVLSFGMFVIGYARADVVVALAGVRGDQALDAATLIMAVTMVIVRRRNMT